MSGSVGAYVALVDRVLGAGLGLFPAGGGPGVVDAAGPGVSAAPGGSKLSTGVDGAGEQYRRSWRGVSGLDAQTTGAAGEGRAEGERGRMGATGVRESARVQAAAIAPVTGSPAGVKLLVSSMDERLAAMQREIETTKAHNRLLATRLRQVATLYRMTGGAAPMGMSAMGGRGAGGLGGLGAMPSIGGGGGMPALGGLSSALSGLGAAGRSGVRAEVTVRSPHGVLPPGRAPEEGLQKYTILVNRAVSAAFPQIREIGGWRADALHWHPDGLALDIMIPGWDSPGGKALGDQVLAFLMANKETLGVDHAIWRQAIHYDGDGGWLMENRGSSTQNHMDHLHVATKGGGYPRGGEVYRL